MYAFFVSGLRSGLRGRSFQAVFMLGLALVGVAYLSGNFSPRQPQTVALDVGLSGMRFTLVLLALFWIQELLARELDRKTILFSLAYPVSRAAFLLGRFLSVAALIALAALVLALALQVAVLMTGGLYAQEFSVDMGLAYWVTILGLVLDVVVVAAFGMCIASVATTAIMPLAMGGAFAIGGKALGATFDYLATGADGDVQMTSVFGPLIRSIRWLVPDLSRLDWRDWALYSLPPDVLSLGWALVMALCYAALCLTLAVILFSRRELA
jgi:Cu-processing system permease protein